MELIATRTVTYATRRLSPGDRFSAPNSDARILIAIQKAKVFVEATAVASDLAEPQDTEKIKRSRKRRSTEKEEPHGLLES